jgi:mucin-19
MFGGAGNRQIVTRCKQKLHRPLTGAVVKALTLLLLLPVYPFFTTPPAFADTPVTSGLVLNLNGSVPSASNNPSYNGTTWFDQSGNGSNATAVNAPTYNSADGSFSFNGTNQYFDLGNILQFTSAFSIEVTFTPSSVTGVPMLVARQNSSVAGNYFVGLSNSKAAYFVESTPWGINSASTLSTGTKYTATLVYDANKDITPYLDGVLNGVKTNHPNTLAGNNIKLLIGASLTSSVASNFFSGKIYSVRIYNRALSSGEVLQSYNSKTCSPSSQTASGYTILTFTNTGPCNWSVPAGVTSADVLTIGGGGAGGGGVGGGGGAGEFIETTRSGLTGGSTVLISVGAGGTPNSWAAGNAGQSSRFDSIIAYGGGGGGINTANPAVSSGGPGFGSQGGNDPERPFVNEVQTRSDGITGFRNNGGAGSGGGSGNYTAGGGGGAGGAGGAGTTASGSPAQTGGAGGAGKSSSISGASTFYAAGGGGGVNGATDFPNGSTASSSGSPGVGGSGIGGSAGAKANAASPGNYGNRGDGTGGTVNSYGSAGATNTGSGGGGASNWVSGGAGGSGIVIIRYISADVTAPTFTSSSSFSAAENIATSSAAATIKVSESATVTISSGADAALFTISNSDSVTALIKFKVSPDYEAPSDSGANNVYDLVLTATDPSGNAGTQTITITVTDVVETSTFNSLVLSGAASYRQVVTITANVSVTSRVSFRAKNIIISGCKNKLTSGSSPNMNATCTWKPAMRGAVVITATATPTNGGISGATSTPVSVVVGNRVGAR